LLDAFRQHFSLLRIANNKHNIFDFPLAILAMTNTPKVRTGLSPAGFSSLRGRQNENTFKLSYAGRSNLKAFIDIQDVRIL
jgi:hypothetical protein